MFKKNYLFTRYSANYCAPNWPRKFWDFGKIYACLVPDTVLFPQTRNFTPHCGTRNILLAVTPGWNSTPCRGNSNTLGWFMLQNPAVWVCLLDRIQLNYLTIIKVLSWWLSWHVSPHSRGPHFVYAALELCNLPWYNFDKNGQTTDM